MNNPKLSAIAPRALPARQRAHHLPVTGRAPLVALAGLSAESIEDAARVITIASRAALCLWVHHRDNGDDIKAARASVSSAGLIDAVDDLRRVWQASRREVQPTLGN